MNDFIGRFQLNLLSDGCSVDDYSYIGRFIGEATKHWTEREIAWAFSQFDSNLQLRKKIDRFYTCEHGKSIFSTLTASFLCFSRY